ncbi:GntR family transcriptional regulator [Salimicrobium halophilum]|uniref:DNA-binding transcriptional regulator, GntR family n=1 Tax=Salimicrobium halophilum TaxID=86666 RepID=A0A1G8SCG0_9BACI|nr:GntR family transcriptional regulator [Salimicrobium halophilum]SDJ26887.1 DNA-binding transcriptional regulator, GntR family [Salimicrobium halophilum]
MNAYNYIKEGITQGKFAPGMRLTEEYLAKELDLSRTPIREAIKELKSEGLIIPQKRGIRVREFTKEDIRQIYDLRTLLEGYAASQAALHRTEEDLEVLRAANNVYEDNILNYEEDNFDQIIEIVEANQRFHEGFISASKNEHIKFHISKVVVVPIIFRSFYWYNHEKLKRSLDYHNIILTAIENQDPERARIAAHEHIYQGRDQVLSQMEKFSESEEENE